MLTRQLAKAAFKHVLEVLFQLTDDQPLFKALEMAGFNNVHQLINMTLKDIDDLTYLDESGNETSIP